jgi:hypothetical protein
MTNHSGDKALPPLGQHAGQEGKNEVPPESRKCLGVAMPASEKAGLNEQSRTHVAT